MKDIVKYLTESKTVENFSKATVAAIKQNILGMKVKFNIEGWDFKNFKVFEKDKYIMMSYTAIKKDKKKTINEKGDLIFIKSDRISFGYSGNSLDFTNTYSYSRDRYAELISIEYDEKKNLTCLEYKLKSHRYNDGFEWLSGTVKLYIPTDIMNAKESYSIDCKGYDKFMEKYLPAKREYFDQINPEDLKFWSSMMENNEMFITLELETGKGYGDNHHRTKDYNFIWKDYSYKCDIMLADRDHEAQIVRKFISGLQEFLGKEKDKKPEKVHVKINQELD